MARSSLAARAGGLPGGVGLSVISAERIRREIQARFNPIRGLTPEVLSQQLEQFKLGYLRQMALTWEAMENRDLHLKNVAMKRKKAVARHGWEILTVDDSPEAEAQKEALENFYENIRVTSVMEQDQQGGLSLLVRQMMDAVGKRYAVHEIVWVPGGTATAPAARRGKKKKPAGETPIGATETAALPGAYLSAEFRFCPLWFFENRTGQLRFLQDAYAMEGVEMPKQQWLVTVGDGIMEGCSVAYMFKHLPLKDWLAFSEKFGMPGTLGKTQAKKDSAEWAAMVEAVKNFGQDWAAVVSAGEGIEFVELKGSQQLPYPPLVEYCDKRMAAAWRGADLSTISGTGPDSSGASLQDDEERLIQEDDAQWISETLNNRVDCHVIRHLFGTDECLAYIKITAPQKDTIDRDLKIDQHLVSHGAKLSLQDAMERYGRTEAKDGEELMEAARAQAEYQFVNGQRGLGGLNGQARTNGNEHSLENESGTRGNSSLQERAKEALAKALAADLAPVRERIERILAIQDEGLQREKFAAFLAELPQLVKDIGADPESARAFEAATTAALFNGFEAGVKRA